MKALFFLIIVFLLSVALFGNETSSDTQLPVSSEIKVEESKTTFNKIVSKFISFCKKIPSCFAGEGLGGEDFGGSENGGKFGIIQNAIAKGLVTDKYVNERLEARNYNIDLVNQDILTEIKKRQNKKSQKTKQDFGVKIGGNDKLASDI